MKNQRGSSVIAILATISLVNFAILNFVYIPHQDKKIHEGVRNYSPTVTVEYQNRVNKAKKEKEQKWTPQGKFYDTGKVSGKKYEIVYTFTDHNRLIKKFTILNDEFVGEADYEIEGAVLKFQNVKGAKGLFILEGEIFYMMSEDVFVTELDNKEKHTLIRK